MSGQNNPELSPKDPENEELQDIEFAKRGCCFWFPSFRCGGRVWERVSTSDQKEESHWWDKGFKAVMKVREWSEVVAGPKWKTFIRRFNKKSSKTNKYNYDPLSYSLNFDDGPGVNEHSEDDRFFCDFSSRYASIPVSAKSSMDLGKDPPSFL
ncbi:putative potassium transporter 8-like [Capsicum annuum]|uniref:Uncharacterized protein n=1 Tax=Capsicum annuum TaxID=4072 RepID=A0A2G3AC07_CAPAN|nr:putative potassium transporter 8-like [Capsicum annuum]KAF3660210.1 putative potassium transporter 8-like [Capsicum annuum]PHT91767.1 hypothetical protein T459_06880 [Capsicum annuum]